ncbi:unnamed protein product [Brassicogethes aeneus]|uniref:Uncharacterized protein n=1 Tax=Brassicogethes aeneus TaxID=1431903 RepID=A0A9P0F8V5_BRAAE|nr:unnamed protein product [Brassicogethes aeneus]
MSETVIVGTVANRGCIPNLDTEGVFLKPLVKSSYRGSNWASNLSPFERLSAHQTLASARRFIYFRPFPGTIPSDELDFILTAQYNHTSETFADKQDTVLQPETVNKSSWKRLRNTSDIRESKHAISGPEFESVKYGSKSLNRVKLPYRYNNAHPVMIGGIAAKKHPSSVKLLISSHHSPLSNAGYSRQPQDGTLFQY